MLQEGLIHETGSSWRGVIHETGSSWRGVIHKTGSSVDVHRFRLCCKRGLYTKPEVVGGAYSRNRK